MARDRDQLTVAFENENTGGVLSGFLADEDVFDRRTLLRIGAWAATALGAIVLAVLSNQSSLSVRREQVAAVDVAHQAQQIQSVAKESQNESRRLASAVETLNSDRDRLYSRVSVLEQGLESVTGTIARQKAVVTVPPPAPAKTASAASDAQAAQNSVAAPAPATPSPPAAAMPPTPVVSPVATTAAKTADKPPVVEAVAPTPPPATVASLSTKTSDPQVTSAAPAALAAAAAPIPPPPPPLVPAKSMMAPPDAAASKLIEPEKPAKAVASVPMPEVVASTPPADKTDAAEKPDARESAPVASSGLVAQKTQFGVDIGGANSVPGLRALWRGLLKSRSNAVLMTLRPIIVIKEASYGPRMQLRLVAGPLDDAAAAAAICAGLLENKRPCETAVFDGQRLTMKGDETGAVSDAKASVAKPATKPYVRRRGGFRRQAGEEAEKKPIPPSALASFFGRR